MGSCERCKLTVPGFGERVANLFAEDGFTLNGLRLLDFAHYYKVEPGTKVVLAVDEEEKRELQNLFLPEDLRVYPSTPHGPMALVRTEWEERTEAERRRIVEVAACIVATHASGGRAGSVPIYYRFESDDETLLVHGTALSLGGGTSGALRGGEHGPRALGTRGGLTRAGWGLYSTNQSDKGCEALESDATTSCERSARSRNERASPRGLGRGHYAFLSV